MRRAVVLALPFLALIAAASPRPGPVDPHIQRVLYDPEQVVSLQGAMGWQIAIEFAPDERIENVAIGDSLAWQVTPNRRAKMLFLKPLLRNGSTNMTVVTSQRHYAFALSTGPRLPLSPWIVRFDFPRSIVETAPEPPPPPQAKLNFGYTSVGDPSVLPARVWDDGRQTYFEFAQDSAFPAIFAAGPGKNDEALVNVATRGRVQIVQQMGERFVLRSGLHAATVTRGE